MHFVRPALTLAVVALALASRPADACGCFAPPNAVEPIVQAGERILFSVDNGVVTAHIQIQYAGDARNFGWLLPLPSVPTLEVGSDELFTRLGATTQPTYQVQNVNKNTCPSPPQPISFGCESSRPVSSTKGGFIDETQDSGVANPLVVAASVGPYDYAVLRADDQTAMLDWLNTNHFFVPSGIQNAVGRYINPGAYFLALKLRTGASSGDVTPVVLKYASALPMIPIVLTSVGAQPNMGIQVWMLGNGRGIPRNYRHVVINDALLDWVNGAANYSQLITQAVAEAPDKHAFVTEYAGPSDVMRDQLTPLGRFGTQAELETATSPGNFVSKLRTQGFDVSGTLPSPVLALLAAQVPYPDSFAATGVTPDLFYGDLDFYLGTYRTSNPDLFVGYASAFDAPALARHVFDTYVKTMRATNASFAQFTTLTRLVTTLSPEDMTVDPVFSFNPALPEVKREHVAKLVFDCGEMHLETEQGWVVTTAGTGIPPPTTSVAPAALQVEVLAEEGQPMVATDNVELVHKAFKHPDELAKPTTQNSGGCTTVDPMSVGLLLLMASLRRRRR
jgi:hypothetical protein